MVRERADAMRDGTGIKTTARETSFSVRQIKTRQAFQTCIPAVVLADHFLQ